MKNGDLRIAVLLSGGDEFLKDRVITAECPDRFNQALSLQ